MVKRAGSDSGNGGPRSAPVPAAEFDFAAVLSIADALPMAIAFVDADLTYRFANKALSEFLECPRSRMIGRTMADILPAEVMAARRPLLAAALAGEQQWFAAEYPHPSRGPLAVQSEYLPQKDAAGRVTGIIIIAKTKNASGNISTNITIINHNNNNYIHFVISASCL